MTVGEMGESLVIRRIQEAHGTNLAPEDAAIVPQDGAVALTVDDFIEGVHFRLDRMTAGDVGWRSVMGTLSDLAAVGAQPRGHLLSLALPPATPENVLGELARGMADAARRTRSPLLGGNVTVAPEIHISLAALGHTAGPALRRRGRPGDVVIATGPLGLAAQGLREILSGKRASEPAAKAFLRPEARLSEGMLLRRAGVRSLTDVTDGLSTEIHEIMGEDARGARLESGALLAGRKRETLPFILDGGEDYELLAAVDASALEACQAALARAGCRPLIVMGILTGEEGIRIDGEAIRDHGGWDPFHGGSA